MAMLIWASALGAVAVKPTTAIAAAARAQVNLFMNPPQDHQSYEEANVRPPNYASIPGIENQVTSVTLGGGGGARGPNYDRASVRSALDALREAGLPERLIVDASHGNSERDHLRQPVVVREIAEQIAAGERGIAGVMVESFLVAGRQELSDPSRLVYGQSITDACIGWDDTVVVLQDLATAVRERRERAEGQRPRAASTKR